MKLRTLAALLAVAVVLAAAGPASAQVVVTPGATYTPYSGSVVVPGALRPYMGTDRITRRG